MHTGLIVISIVSWPYAHACRGSQAETKSQALSELREKLYNENDRVVTAVLGLPGADMAREVTLV